MTLSIQQCRASPSSDDASLEKRQAILSNSDMTTIGDAVPLDLIILIAVAMGFALFCLILAIVNVRRPMVAGSRLITDERSRAMSELRVRGIGGHSAKSAKRLALERTPRGPIASTLSATTADSKSQLLPNGAGIGSVDVYPKSSGLVGPRLAGDRPSRASRGYSFYTTKNYPTEYASPPRRPMMQRSLLTSSSVQVPILPAAQFDTNSETSSITATSPPVGAESSYSAGKSYVGARSSVVGPRPLPSHARPQRPRSNTAGSRQSRSNHNRISSTTVGRGANYGRSMDKTRNERKDLPLPPQMIDPAYGYPSERSSPRGKVHGRFELHRSNTDSRDAVTPNTTSSPNSRRNSTSGSPIRTSSWFDGSGSESHSTEHYSNALSAVQHPLQPRSQIPRTRPLGMYDLEQQLDAEQSGNQLTGLLHGTQASTNTRQSWRAWG